MCSETEGEEGTLSKPCIIFVCSGIIAMSHLIGAQARDAASPVLRKNNAHFVHKQPVNKH